NIDLLVSDSIPRFGNTEWLEILDLNMDLYTIFRTGKKEKFVLGDPRELNDQIDAKLGYHKDFPYLPF
ncbi:MAG: chlorohydrolase, partial [Candidatus Cloacimonadaceae bacterium]|nr:chlorohydrolase [Candidatus Cloacimonadaceae bacterium]